MGQRRPNLGGGDCGTGNPTPHPELSRTVGVKCQSHFCGASPWEGAFPSLPRLVALGNQPTAEVVIISSGHGCAERDKEGQQA
jgi:hypothetical protein